MRQCPADLIALAHQLADVARPIARTYFRQNLGLEIKDDATPVTLADRAIEQEWRKIIMQKRPDDGILGEEFGTHQSDAEYQWIFDPIDGTQAFTLGRTSFGCLIALHHKQHGFILGLCDQPITDERWVGAVGHPTTYNDNELQQRSLDVRHTLRVGITNPMRFKPALQQCLDALLAQKHVIGYGGNCLNFADIASGVIDLSFENCQSIYDVAAFIPILRGVGGVITQSNGKPIGFNMGDGVLAAATPELHRMFLALASNEN